MRSALALLVVLATGCAIGPNYRRPAIDVPETHRAAEDATDPASLADLAWWEVFDDPILHALVAEALSANYDVGIAAARVEQARNLVGVVRSDMLPQVGYQGAASRRRNPNVGTDGSTFNRFTGVLDVAWELDVWGRIRRATESARADLLATEAIRRGVMLSLVADVAQSYFELRELDAELEIARRTTVAFEETRALFATQYEGGVATRLEVVRAEAALEQTAARIPDLERLIVIKENGLALLLGRNPGPIARGAELSAQRVAPDVPAGLPSALLERRPDVQQAEQAVVASNARIGVAIANFFPRIGLTAAYGAQSSELRDIASGPASLWNVAGSMAGPIFQSGRLWFGYQAAEAEWEATKLAYEQTARAAFGDVSNVLVTREKLVGIRAKQERAVRALREAVELSRSRYEAGLANYFEVLEAQQQLFPAENDLTRTLRDQLVAVIQLYRALGGGWALDDAAWTAPPADGV